MSSPEEGPSNHFFETKDEASRDNFKMGKQFVLELSVPDADTAKVNLKMLQKVATQFFYTVLAY